MVHGTVCEVPARNAERSRGADEKNILGYNYDEVWAMRIREMAAGGLKVVFFLTLDKRHFPAF